MKKIYELVNEFESKKAIDFNPQNFYQRADNERYENFLKEIVFKYIKNNNDVTDHIYEINNKNHLANSGIYEREDGIRCTIPKRIRLIDEMISIHEITHLISELQGNSKDDAICKEVIPYFNEYEFLYRIHPFYAECYEKLRYNDAVRSAKYLRASDNKENNLAHIYAYYVLEKRKEDYKIEQLNKINSKQKSLRFELNKKGYTL